MWTYLSLNLNQTKLVKTIFKVLIFTLKLTSYWKLLLKISGAHGILKIYLILKTFNREMYILITWSYLSTKERYFNKLKIKIFSWRLFLKISQRILKIVTDFKLYTEKTIQTAGLKSNVDTITQRRLRYFAYCFPVLHLPSHGLSPYLS